MLNDLLIPMASFSNNSGPLGAILEKLGDFLLPKTVAKAGCQDPNYVYCNSTCGRLCTPFSVPNGLGYWLCLYYEVQHLHRLGYPGNCESTCEDDCACYKIYSNPRSCDSDCSGCTWA